MRPKQIVIANRGLLFDGDTIRERPIGGVEMATVALAEALVKRGHEVAVHGSSPQSNTIRGVHWRPLEQMPLSADIYIANRDHELLLKVPFAKKRILWMHNPAYKIDEWPFRIKMSLLPPIVVVLGAYHRSTCPDWMLRYRVETIPLAVLDEFLHQTPSDAAPARRAIFTSNPARNLDWLLRIWEDQIWPHLKDAELHLFSGPEVYHLKAGRGFTVMTEVLTRAEAMAHCGVVRHAPTSRERLLKHIATSRVMLYRGHEEETFCLALAEAQALGVPCVVQPIGSTTERVLHNVTGCVATSDEEFARSAVRLLSDDELWLSMHQASLAQQRERTWDQVASHFEALQD